MIEIIGLIMAIVAGLGLIAALIVWQITVARKRREALQAWAQEHGFHFIEKDAGLHAQFARFSPFGTGTSRICRNVLDSVHDGHPVRLFQYEYTVQNGKSSTTYVNRVAAVRMAESGRDLSIQKEHFGHKLVDALGGEDIDFESDEFSRTFWVKCKDRRFAYDILHPRMQEWLLESGRRHWQWQDGTLLIYETGRLEARWLDGLLGQVFGFIERLPRHRSVAEAST